MWEEYRKHHLSRYEEHKKKGLVDPGIPEIVERINKREDVVTLSSCYGRIVLIESDEEDKKRPEAFRGKWHREVSREGVWEIVEEFEGEVLWFKFEPFILHVATKSIGTAKLLLRSGIEAGFKHSGIISMDEVKYVVEIRGTDYISSPVYVRGYRVDEGYVGVLVHLANVKFRRNRERVGLFTSLLEEYLGI